MSRPNLRSLLVIAGAASLLAIPSVAGAAPAAALLGSSAANPVPLAGAEQGHLAGNSGGAYQYYQLQYPGDGSDVTLNLTTDNATPLNSGAAGINVDQDGNLLTTASQNGPFADQAIFSSATAGPILVQLFDYDAGNSINFTLTAQGLPAQPAAAAATASAPAASNGASSAPASTGAGSAEHSLSLNGSVQGRLAGNSGGDFATYQLSYPGDGSNVTLTLTTDNSAPLNTGAAGINVYQDGNLLTTSSQSGPFAATAFFNASSADPITVQVFDYDPGNAITFTLSSQH